MANTQAFITIGEIKRIVRIILLQIYDNYLEKSQIEKKNNINFEDFSEINQETILNLNKIFKLIYDRAKELQDRAITAKEKINRINKERKESENKNKTPEEKADRKNNKKLKETLQQEEINKIVMDNYNRRVEFEIKRKERVEYEKILSELRAIDSANKIKELIKKCKEEQNYEALDHQLKILFYLYERNKNIQVIAEMFNTESKSREEIKEENRRKTEERNKIIKNEKKMLKKLKEKERKRKNFEEKETERKLQVTEINLSKITNEKKNQTYCMAALASASYPLLLFAAIGATDSLSAIPEFLSGEVGTVFLNCATLFTTYNSLMGYIRNWYIDANKEKITKILEKLIGKTEIEKEDIYNTLNANDKKLIDDLEKKMEQVSKETAELET